MNFNLLPSLILLATQTLFCMGFTPSVYAEISIIVHPQNRNAIDEKYLQRIFLGKVETFPDGMEAVPIAQAPNTPSAKYFNHSILKKDEEQLNSYWARIIFTGKGRPPKAVISDAKVLELVSQNPNLVGYVDSSAVTGAVKVISKF